MSAVRLEDPAGLDFLIPYFLLGLACDTPVLDSLCHSLPPSRLTNYVQRALFKDRIHPLVNGRFHTGNMIEIRFACQYLTVAFPGMLDEYYWTGFDFKKKSMVFYRYWHPSPFTAQSDEYDRVGPWLSELDACLTTRGVLNLFCKEFEIHTGIETKNLNPFAQRPALLVNQGPYIRLSLHPLGKTLHLEFDFQSITGSLLEYDFQVAQLIGEFEPVWMVKVVEEHSELPVFDCVPLETWLEGLSELFAKIPLNRDNSPKQSRRKVRSG